MPAPAGGEAKRGLRLMPVALPQKRMRWAVHLAKLHVDLVPFSESDLCAVGAQWGILRASRCRIRLGNSPAAHAIAYLIRSAETGCSEGPWVDDGFAPCQLVCHHHATQTAQGQADVLMAKGVNDPR